MKITNESRKHIIPFITIILALSLALPCCDSAGTENTAAADTSALADIPLEEDSEAAVDYEPAQAPAGESATCQVLWSLAYGGEAADNGRSIAATPDGGLALAGYTKSSGAGLTDFLAIRLDAQGAPLWSKTFGSSDNDLAYGVAATADGGLVLAGEKRIYSILDEFNLTSSYRYDFWIVKLDAEGNSIWSKTFGGSDYDAATAIIECADGGYAVAGYTQSYGAQYEPEAHAKKDLWVVRLDAAGNKTWECLYGTEKASDCAQSIRQCADGGFIVAGFTGPAGENSYDCLLLRLDENGDALWSDTAGGAGYDRANSVIETDAGDFITVGETTLTGTGTTDFYVMRHDSAGVLLWSRTFGGAGFERARSIVSAGDDSYIIAGYTSSTGAGNRDLWLVKINASGEMTWQQSLGGESCDEGFAITATADGCFAVAGNTSSSGAGEIDCWVVKFRETAR